ncbi:OmpA family protein [Photobacterium lipolyticum]|uniref:OmpA-like domain-containing protein n=1 Tax=Photobacterium lipolyticum TaxID=266810 RepID=A0A2T3MW26_9GAMM|nr:OmpA family protein [Photobacterium lipolyticum]PSW04141.1 hypothetical protein C9I89_14250 [Photobacterium lipolyticum]
MNGSKQINMCLAVIATLLLAGCANNDIVAMDTPTEQVHDLQDVDRDGVIKAREMCTDTLNGAQVNNDGCGKVRSIAERRELNILFANNSSYISPRYYGQIDILAKFMRSYPDTQVTIEGHCSKIGSHEKNMTLSQQRADAIANALVSEFGIDNVRVKAVGYGFTRPVDPSLSEIAHQRNRRVIAEVTGNNKATEMRWDIYTVDQQPDE